MHFLFISSKITDFYLLAVDCADRIPGIFCCLLDLIIKIVHIGLDYLLKST